MKCLEPLKMVKIGWIWMDRAGYGLMWLEMAKNGLNG